MQTIIAVTEKGTKMNREQIIKALECCYVNGNCKGCPLYLSGDLHSNCIKKAAVDALALIKELTEENERLKAERDTLEVYYKDYKYRNGELQKDNRRWAEEYNELNQVNESLIDDIAKAKADTVKRFAERLKDTSMTKWDYHEAVDVDEIDRTAQEMLGETE